MDRVGCIAYMMCACIMSYSLHYMLLQPEVGDCNPAVVQAHTDYTLQKNLHKDGYYCSVLPRIP